MGETAKTLSERFGKVLQKRQSISINRQDVSTSINTQMDSLIHKETKFGLKDILLMAFLYLVQQFLLFTFGAQDKGTYQQGCQ